MGKVFYDRYGVTGLSPPGRTYRVGEFSECEYCPRCGAARFSYRHFALGWRGPCNCPREREPSDRDLPSGRGESQMSRIHIYLGGPMRGIKGYNQDAFNFATECLREAGFVVFSPAEEDRRKFPDRDWDNMTGDIEKDGLTGGDMRTIIKGDLDWICDNANMLVLLPGWEKSK